MYYAHFGLSEAPFRITPNTEVFFAGGNRGAILDALIYAISQGEGIVKVTGEVGTGKTMLCSMLQSRLPAHIETVYLAHPSVSPDEILHAIAFELQLKVARDANRMEVMQALYGYLLERHAQNKQVVIFIEESQNMPLATLEEVRLLSNLETGKHKLLQIVLFGQPELDDNLRQPHIRQLRERITHSFALPPLAGPEVGEYLMFRLRAAGYRGPDLFSAHVIKRIAQASAGLTRRINLIADKALLAAFSENTHTVQTRHVLAAIRDSEFARDGLPASAARRGWLLAGAALVLLAIGAALYWGLPHGQVLPGLRPAGSAPALPGALPQARGIDPAADSGGSQAKAQNAAAGAGVNAAARDTATNVAPPAASGPSAASATAASPASPAAGGDGEAEHVPGRSPDEVSHAPAGSSSLAQAGIGAASARLDPAALQPAAAAPARPGTEASIATPAPTSAPGEAPPSPRDLLAERMQATLEWLHGEPHGKYSIQLLRSENPAQLREHLGTVAKSVEMAEIYVYRTVAGQKPFLTVLYGSFGSREAAQSALDRLPPLLKASRPYVRTVQGIRGELSRNKTL